MNEKRSMNLAPPIHPILGIAAMNFILLILILIVFYSFFARPSGFEVYIPTSARNNIEEDQVTVRVTGENVLYFNDRVVTINDLKRSLIKVKGAHAVIYLSVDRKASMGRVADVWDLCKGLGAARVKIVTLQED